MYFSRVEKKQSVLGGEDGGVYTDVRYKRL